MDTQELAKDRSSRADMIRTARESCMKNLDPNSRTSNATKKALSSVEATTETLPKIRFFVLRLCVAIVIFGAIVLMDQTNFSYQEFNSSFVKEQVVSSKPLEKLEKYINTFITKQDFD